MGDKTKNLKGEQGGEFLEDSGSFSATEQKDYATGFTVITETILTSITMPYYTNESVLVGKVLAAGEFVAGDVSEVTVTSGVIQLHRHTRAS
jgi:hypothetical protein